MEYKRVYLTEDDDGHWYVLPYELSDQFYYDQQNEQLVDSGEFDNKYGQYRTGGSLNLVEFYIKIDG